MLQRRVSIVIGGKEYWIWVEGVWDTGPNKRQNSARALGLKKEGKLRWKLFHREERPALERNIIDTSTSDVSNRLICENGWHCGSYIYERTRRTCRIL